MPSSLLGKLLEVEGVCDMVAICLNFQEIVKLIFKTLPFAFPPAMYESTSCFTHSLALSMSAFLILANFSAYVLVSH